jgi:hypothetical protein
VKTALSSTSATVIDDWPNTELGMITCPAGQGAGQFAG